MKVVAAVSVLACILCLKQSEGVTVEFARLCEENFVSHGFRKDVWQENAIHYCYKSNLTSGNCREFSANNVGINCKSFGENYHLQGGKPNRTAVCCETPGYSLKNCSVQRGIFSFMKGVNIMYFQRVLRRLIPLNSTADPTLFEIELCSLVEDTTVSTTIPRLSTTIPLPPPVPNELKETRLVES